MMTLALNNKSKYPAVFEHVNREPIIQGCREKNAMRQSKESLHFSLLPLTVGLQENNSAWQCLQMCVCVPCLFINLYFRGPTPKEMSFIWSGEFLLSNDYSDTRWCLWLEAAAPWQSENDWSQYLCAYIHNQLPLHTISVFIPPTHPASVTLSQTPSRTHHSFSSA